MANASLENFLGPSTLINGIGKGFTTKITESLIKKLGQQGAKKALSEWAVKIGASSGEEALEEILQLGGETALQDVAQEMGLTKEDAELLKPSFSEYLDNGIKGFIGGFALGGAVGGVQALATNSKEEAKATDKEAENNKKLSTLWESTTEVDEELDGIINNGRAENFAKNIIVKPKNNVLKTMNETLTKIRGQEPVFFASTDKTINGIYNGNNGKVYINVNNATKNPLFTFGHEFFHYAEQTMPEQSKTFINSVFSNLTKTFPEYALKLEELYGTTDVNTIKNEHSADVMGDLFLDKKLWQSMNEGKIVYDSRIKQVAHKVVEFIDFVLEKLGSGSGALKYIKELEAVKTEAIKLINAGIKQNLDVNALVTTTKNIPSYSQFVEAMKNKEAEAENIKRYANKEEMLKAEQLTEGTIKPKEDSTKGTNKTGFFGEVFNQFYHKANEAVEQLLRIKNGEAVGALHHKDIGDIDLVWGKEGTKKSDGYGLAKIAKYHPEVLNKLQEVLDESEITQRGTNRLKLESEKYFSAISLNYLGNEKKWLLTSYEKNKDSLGRTMNITKNQNNSSDRVNDTAPHSESLNNSIPPAIEKNKTVEVETAKPEPTQKPLWAMSKKEFGNEFKGQWVKKVVPGSYPKSTINVFRYIPKNDNGLKPFEIYGAQYMKKGEEIQTVASKYLQKQRDAIINEAIKRGEVIPDNVLKDYSQLNGKEAVNKIDMLKANVKPYSTSNNRIALSGVHFDAESKVVVATDGISLVQIHDNSINETKTIAVKDMKNDKRETLYKKGETIKEQYPKYKAVIPPVNESDKIAKNINVKTLLDKLNGIIKENRMYKNDNKEIIRSVFTDGNILDTKRIFNNLMSLASNNVKTVDIYQLSEGAPLIIKDTKNEKNLIAIMPYRGKAEGSTANVLTGNKIKVQNDNIKLSKSLDNEIDEIKNKYINTDKWLKAPNGKATKLNELQWLQVRTQAFKNWFGDWETLAKINEVMTMKPVKAITGNEFQKDDIPLTDKVTEYYTKNYNNKVINPELGTINLLRGGVKASIAHGIGAKKSSAFMVVPEVIQNGLIIDRQSNWKNRGYDTVIISAPVSINGIEHVAEVIVIKDKETNNFYLHEVDIKEKLQKLENPIILNDKGEWAFSPFKQLVDKNIITQNEYSNLKKEYGKVDSLLKESSKKAIEFAHKLLKNKGIDGVIYNNNYEGDGNSYIAFDPTQIKSATANIGTFDGSNPNIKFSKALPSTPNPTFTNDDKTNAFVENAIPQAMYDVHHLGDLSNNANFTINTLGYKKVVNQLAEVNDKNDDEQVRLFMSALAHPDFTELMTEDYDTASKVAENFLKLRTKAGQMLGALRRIAGKVVDEEQAAFKAFILAPSKQYKEDVKNKVKDAAKNEWERINKIRDEIKAKFGVDPFDDGLMAIQGDKFKAKIAREVAIRRATIGDKVYEYWINGILSGFKTQWANVIGNVGFATSEFFINRPVEAVINVFAGKTDAATFGEYKYMMKAFGTALRPAFQNAVKAFMLEKAVTVNSTKMEGGLQSISDKAGGRFIRIPGRLLLMMDELSKGLIIPIEATAMAYRLTRGLSNQAEAMQGLLKDHNSNAMIYAKQRALELTFQTEGGKFVQLINHLKTEGGAWGTAAKYVFPFVKTPANIIKTATRKSPLGTVKLINDFAKGKFDSDNRAIHNVAEQMLAWSIVAILYSMVGDDDEHEKDFAITGAPAQYGTPEYRFRMEAGIPPRSIKLGGKWFDYSRVEPISEVLSLVVDGIHSWKNVKKGGDFTSSAGLMFNKEAVYSI